MMLWPVKRGPKGIPSFFHNRRRRQHVMTLRHKQLFVGLSIILFVLLSLHSIIFNGGKRIEKRVSRQKRIRQTPKKLQCSDLERMTICSHQLLNAPRSGNIPAVDGSLEAMTLLWEAGIRCFDVDAVTLKSGELLASHPSRFAKGTQQSNKKAEEFTLEEARQTGANKTAFPLLDTLLMHYSKLIATNSPRFSQEGDPKRRLGPLLNIDLKGPNLTKSHLQSIQETITKLKIQSNVAIVATSLNDGEVGPGVDILDYLGHGDVPLGLVLRDREKQDWDINRIHTIVNQNPGIRLFVPSYKFKTSWFKKVQQDYSTLPIVGWTVDDKEALIHAVQGGLAAVVSNYPMTLARSLGDLLKQEGCNMWQT